MDDIWMEGSKGKRMMTMSEVIHEALVKAREIREELEPITYDYLLATDVMKSLADLEFRTFNQEMNAEL